MDYDMNTMPDLVIKKKGVPSNNYNTKGYLDRENGV